MDEARRATGLSDFGDEAEFMPHLARLLEALEHEAGLNAWGRQLAQARTVSALKNRLWIEACLRAHPEIDERPLPAPLVIVGPHRSGTTRLHRMLACDPRWAWLRTWEGLAPAPRGARRDADDAAQRRKEAVAALAERRRRWPEADAMHAMQADAPEEEMLLLNQSFCSFQPLGLFDIPGWYRYWRDADKTAAYRGLLRQLKLVAWARGEAPGRRWLLKNPQHMLELPLLHALLPDAQFVFTHRDPLKTVGSVVSMMVHFSSTQTDRDCRRSVRDTWLDFCETAARRSMDARAALPPSQQFDLHYDALDRDALARLYAFAGLDFAPHADAVMAAGRHDFSHGRHEYRLQDHGLTAAEVEKRMAFVRQRYTIAQE